MPTFVTMTGPGTGSVVDDAAVAIGLQTTALTGAIALATTAIKGVPGTPVPGTLTSIEAQLNAINDNLTRIADSSKGLSSQMSKLSVDISGLGTAMNSSLALQAMSVASQVKTDNFQTQVTKDALARAGIPEPEMPPLKQQFEAAVKDGVEFNAISRTMGAITTFLTNTLTDIGTWAAGTAAYKTVDKWISDIKDSILSPSIPSLETIASKAASFLGIKKP
jgi:hypothetical protein